MRPITNRNQSLNSLIGCLLIVFIGPILRSTIADAESVTFANKNLKSAVEKALGVADPTPEDMLALTELRFKGNPYREERSITDLTGLETARNLKTLALENNHHINNLSVLSQLTRLQELDLSWNRITDTSTVAALTSLRHLDLSSNLINDISPISGLLNLQELILNGNNIEDISPLLELSHLTVLNVDENPIGIDTCNHQILHIIANNPEVKVVYCHQTNRIDFLNDRFAASSSSTDSVNIRWAKFIIHLDPNKKNIVHFQDSTQYALHYEFATQHLEPFIGMSMAQFNEVTLKKSKQVAVLGSIFFPPSITRSSYAPQFNEVGVEFVRGEPYTHEEIRDLFNIVKSSIIAPNDIEVFYFPKYEQQDSAETHRMWFEAQGIPLGSTAQWIKGNTCYSEGWALGTLKYVTADSIIDAYNSKELLPTDILLTNGIPAELPYMAGIISLEPSTPNSHVAILARSYAIPFAHLAVTEDVNRALDLVGHRLFFSAFSNLQGCETRMIDTDSIVDDPIIDDILQRKETKPLHITPMKDYGAYGVSTAGLDPSDIQYVGGKAANFSILRKAIPHHSPPSLAFTFDLWNAFLDQTLIAGPPIILEPGGHYLLWADNDEEQGPNHLNFRLSKDGEYLGLYDSDGQTLIDAVDFSSLTPDTSLARIPDGGSQWQPTNKPTPAHANIVADANFGTGLVINELMADNRTTLEDPCEEGEYPDWIELYNGSTTPISLNGLYLTDDANNPTKWRFTPLQPRLTLRGKIKEILSAYPSYPPPDMLALSSDLSSIRRLFTDPNSTAFSPELETAVLDHLKDPNNGFNPGANLRFRSSTNVEDAEDFIGAGLYDSFSGCLRDTLDNDTTGPCQCDPNRSNERNVFKAIRRTFASFYNDNAFLERLRHKVVEADAGMAILVHHSFPDPLELANGVATLEYKGANERTEITLVTQLGAVSVTNPQDNSIAEVVVTQVSPTGHVYLNSKSYNGLERQSSLVLLGETVMHWVDDYKELASMLAKISDQFRLATGKTQYILDLEYKKMAPGGEVSPEGGLVVKQVREVPTQDQTQTVTPFLLNDPLIMEVYPGEFSMYEQADVFANHHLKSRWTLETRNILLDNDNLSKGLYSSIQIEYLDGDRIETIDSAISLLPDFSHLYGPQDSQDSWRLDNLANTRVYTLQTENIPSVVSAMENPILTLANLGTYAANTPIKCLGLSVQYEHPVLSINQDRDFVSYQELTLTNDVFLWPVNPPSDDDVLSERSITRNGITVTTSFYFAPVPTGYENWIAIAGATAPLKRWEQTTIIGLTTEPIVLQNYYSQTYRPEHHNEVEHFLFEPRLEPGLSTDTLTELEDRDIRFIHVIIDHIYDEDNPNQSKISTYGFNSI